MNKEREHMLLVGWNTVPNLITFARLLLMIVFAILYFVSGPWGKYGIVLRILAAFIFIVAAVTDKLDGYIARKTGTVTELGKFLDPIADKFLTGSALVVASINGEIFWWVTALFLLREVAITILRMVIINKRGKVIPASRAGKYKTLVQCISLSMILIPVWAIPVLVVQIYAFIAYFLLYFALFLCWFSGVLYIYHGCIKK